MSMIHPHPTGNELKPFLEEKKMSYNQFIMELAKPKGIAGTFFSRMKQLFT